MRVRIELCKKLNPGFQFTEIIVNPGVKSELSLSQREEVLHVIMAIRSGSYEIFGIKSLKELTEKTRVPGEDNYFDHELIDQLPKISFPGIVKEGGYISESVGPTNLMALELDGAGGDDEAMYLIRDFGFVISYFSNVYGGLTVIVRVDYSTEKQYLKSFRQLTRFFAEEIGAVVDLRGEDIGYANIINYDPDAYINWGAVPFQAWIRHF